MVPPARELTPRDDAFPAWDDVPGQLKAFYARQMEVYAGYSENADYNVGRVIDAIEELGELDNTLILWIWGDNGASMEGTVTGSFNELTMQNGIPLTDEMQLQLAERYGGLDQWGGRDHGPPLLGGVGVGREHAVPVGQAGRLAPRRDPQPDGRPLAGPASPRPAGCAPSSPTSSTCADDPGSLAGIPAARYGRRDRAGADARRHVRRVADGRGGTGAPHPAVLRDHRQPRHVQGRLVAGDEDRADPVGAHSRCPATVRAGCLGPRCRAGRAVLPARRLLASQRPRRRPSRRRCRSSRTCSGQEAERYKVLPLLATLSTFFGILPPVPPGDELRVPRRRPERTVRDDPADLQPLLLDQCRSGRARAAAPKA